MTYILIAILFVLATITAGFYLSAQKAGLKTVRLALKLNYALGALLLLSLVTVMFTTSAFAETPVPISATAPVTETTPGGINGLGLIAAAISTGLATIGAGLAVSAVGSSAIGAVSEDSKNLGKTLIFVGLAEGISIFGLIVSIMILGRL